MGNAANGSILVHAYEPGRAIPTGIFFGYISRRNADKVKLYPADYWTKCSFKGDKLDITIYDLKARSNYGV